MGCSKNSSKRKFIAMNAYIYNQERSQTNNLTLLLKELGYKQTEPKVTRIREIINIRAEINEIENRKTIEKINKRSGSLKRSNIDKSLARLIKERRQITQIKKIINEKDITMDTQKFKGSYEATMNNYIPKNWIP